MNTGSSKSLDSKSVEGVVQGRALWGW